MLVKVKSFSVIKMEGIVENFDGIFLTFSIKH